MDTTEPLRQLLDAGFPRDDIIRNAQRHLRDLLALPESVDGREKAIEQVEAFLAELGST